MAIALLQNMFGVDKCMAKLVQFDGTSTGSSGGVLWEETFSDPQRQAWHDAKMKSKLERAARQMAIFPEQVAANAKAYHC